MIDFEELRDKQASFETVRQEYERNFGKLEKIRIEFIKKFPADKTGILPIEKYVAGKEASFCYWLEFKLGALGRIQGGSTAPNKYGVYFGKTKKHGTKKYRALPKWGVSPNEAYENVRYEIVDLLEAGKTKNLERIKQNVLSPMFKGKILATYFPDDYLSVFSEGYVDHYLNELGLSDELDEEFTVEEKRQVLLAFKQKDSVMKKWTTFEFMRFLIDQFRKPADEDKVPNELKKYVSVTYPPMKGVKPDFIDRPNFSDLIEQPERASHEAGRRGYIDFQEKNRRAKKIGDRGELIVVKSETNYLASIGKADLKVWHMSMKDPSAGYDVLSYDGSGNKKHIEVKSTTAKVGEATFIISSNELQAARRLSNYLVYLVFEADTTRPNIIPIRLDELSESKIKITPISYSVKVRPVI